MTDQPTTDPQPLTEPQKLQVVRLCLNTMMEVLLDVRQRTYTSGDVYSTGEMMRTAIFELLERLPK